MSTLHAPAQASRHWLREVVAQADAERAARVEPVARRPLAGDDIRRFLGIAARRRGEAHEPGSFETEADFLFRFVCAVIEASAGLDADAGEIAAERDRLAEAVAGQALAMGQAQTRLALAIELLPPGRTFGTLAEHVRAAYEAVKPLAAAPPDPTLAAKVTP